MMLLTYISIFIGFMFLIGSVIGVFRFKDGYQKMQAVTIATSMSLFWFALGTLLYSLDIVIIVKSILIYLFMLITSAVSSNMLVNASLDSGIPMIGEVNLFPKGGEKR